MPGGTYLHATIIANAAGELHQALKQRPCAVTAIDLRLRVSPTGLHTYPDIPDIMVVCGEVCRFESLDCQILVSDVYQRVTLSGEPA